MLNLYGTFIRFTWHTLTKYIIVSRDDRFLNFLLCFILHSVMPSFSSLFFSCWLVLCILFGMKYSTFISSSICSFCSLYILHKSHVLLHSFSQCLPVICCTNHLVWTFPTWMKFVFKNFLYFLSQNNNVFIYSFAASTRAMQDFGFIKLLPISAKLTAENRNLWKGGKCWYHLTYHQVSIIA